MADAVEHRQFGLSICNGTVRIGGSAKSGRCMAQGLFRSQGMYNPTPRIQMLDGFNEGWISFESGAGSEATVGPTPLKTVLHALLAGG